MQRLRRAPERAHRPPPLLQLGAEQRGSLVRGAQQHGGGEAREERPLARRRLADGALEGVGGALRRLDVLARLGQQRLALRARGERAQPQLAPRGLRERGGVPRERRGRAQRGGELACGQPRAAQRAVGRAGGRLPPPRAAGGQPVARAAAPCTRGGTAPRGSRRS